MGTTETLVETSADSARNALGERSLAMRLTHCDLGQSPWPPRALWPHLSDEPSDTSAADSSALCEARENTYVKVYCKLYTPKQKTASVSRSPSGQACLGELAILRGHRIRSTGNH